jgi:hypothetical protein
MGLAKRVVHFIALSHVFEHFTIAKSTYAGAGNGLGLIPGPGGYVSELGYTIKPRG